MKTETQTKYCIYSSGTEHHRYAHCPRDLADKCPYMLETHEADLCLEHLKNVRQSKTMEVRL